MILLLCAAAASFAPSSAHGALLLADGKSAAGLRAFFTTAGKHTSMASPEALGRELQRAVGVDLLDEPKAWGLAAQGQRALVWDGQSIGLSAPVADAKLARKALEAWLGPKARPTRPKPLKGPLASGDRAGMIAPVGGGLRLLTASGRHAAPLVSALAHVGPRKSDTRPLDPRISGKAVLVLRLPKPLQGASLALEAGAQGLDARGLVFADGVLLDGAAPGPCAGTPLACLRVAPGPVGRTLLSLLLRDYLGRALAAGPRGAIDRALAPSVAATHRFAARADGLDTDLLASDTDSVWALRFTAASDAPAEAPKDVPAGVALSEGALRVNGERSLCLKLAPAALSTPCAEPPDTAPGTAAFDALVDLSLLERALSRLTPLDALRGEVAAGAYAAWLMAGPLLKAAGPLHLEGKPEGNAARVELHLPLR